MVLIKRTIEHGLSWVVVYSIGCDWVITSRCTYVWIQWIGRISNAPSLIICTSYNLGTRDSIDGLSRNSSQLWTIFLNCSMSN